MIDAPAARLSSRNNNNFLIAGHFVEAVAVPLMKSVGAPFFSEFGEH
jgi:hypothetical protein